MNLPKVAIVYLCWADEPIKYLSEALDAISDQTYPKEKIALHIIYNGPRPNEESYSLFIKEQIENKKSRLPETVYFESKNNIGFSAGNNLGIRQAIENGAEYILLHNPDGFLKNNAIEKLVQTMDKDENIGVCQPLMLLHPETNLINSAGNDLHYLFIGYCQNYRREVPKNLFADLDIGYASGAASFVRADLIKKHGLWNEIFFLYHEDTEYSLRLRLLGYSIKLSGQAVFYHKYSFSNKPNKFFWIERNRHGLKLMYYKWPTLFLLLPLEILFNIGLIFNSIFGGWFKELLKVYRYWLNPNNWRIWLSDRKNIQKSRQISDRKLILFTTSFISSGDLKINKLVEIFINFIFTFYRFLLKIIIWW
jgi:hypothetical protein